MVATYNFRLIVYIILVVSYNDNYDGVKYDGGGAWNKNYHDDTLDDNDIDIDDNNWKEKDRVIASGKRFFKLQALFLLKHGNEN